MKLLTILALFLIAENSPLKNSPIPHVDPKRYAGTWYSLYSIPTKWDKGTLQTTARYTWNEKGYFDVHSSCVTENGGSRTANSKLFPSDTGNGALKTQFIWPFKIDYWIIELDEAYSYVVVGDADADMLFIMSRKKEMAPALYKAIVERCRAKGYEVGKLVSQKH